MRWPLLWPLLGATLALGAVRREEAAAPLSVSACKVLQEMDLVKTSKSDCYCYHPKSQLEWKYIWSTVQVHIASQGLLSITYITERHHCQYPESIPSFIRCLARNFWPPRESNEITIVVNPYEATMCFSLRPGEKIVPYTLSVNRNIVDFRLFLMFVAGVSLFYYAETLSRSPLFYYSSGTVLGILMTLVFVLLLVKKSIPKYSTFWALMVGCWSASVYIMCRLIEELKWLTSESRTYILGYFLTVGLVSFAVCYKHGPLVEATSRNLLAWTLRLLSLLLVCSGITMAPLAYAVGILMLSSRVLRFPRKAFRRMKTWLPPAKPQFKYLTEDEYREQADAETTGALEELRQACRRPDFPSWLAVARLQSPKKAHVNSNMWVFSISRNKM
ncbi:nuclear envelope integral membrane protein 2 isoform X2 [Erinaceus europaeus]|uniref:Nuclear envelope integral membrane protein 2 isoform X2 n=1 Tax=Erinaceus europaeus TaxID=9365 RepID=A0ABM3WAG8_ERIEU|nr:nuclear envelope integral membrane protein 2 isoform X2 [Erinaceus europaeus]